MKLKEQYLISKNVDGTISIYDLENDCFYNLNSTASIVFENIEFSVGEVAKQIALEFDVNENDIILEIEETFQQLKEVFFYQDEHTAL